MRKENELYHSSTYLGSDYSDGIKHYKYIKKEPNGRGGYTYIYKDNKGNVYQKDNKGQYGTYKTPRSELYERDINGKYRRVGENSETVHVKKSNKLFSSTKTLGKYANNNYGYETVKLKEVGKIEQTIDKGKKAISNLFKKKLKNIKLNNIITTSTQSNTTIIPGKLHRHKTNMK